MCLFLGRIAPSTVLCWTARNGFVTQWSLVSLEELRDLFSLSQKKEVVSKLKNQPVKITFELSRELQTTSPDCLCYYNILFRRYVSNIVCLRFSCVLLCVSDAEHSHLFLAFCILDKSHVLRG